MYCLSLTRQLMLARTSVPMFQSKVVQWIAPDHLLTIKSKQ
jgi:hypothetical protein